MAQSTQSGSSWRYDSPLDKFKQLKERYGYEPRSHFKPCVNLRWNKLDKYYCLSDDTFENRIAIFLHPHLKMAWFENHWRCRPACNAAKDAIDTAYALAKARWPLSAQEAVSLNSEMGRMQSCNH